MRLAFLGTPDAAVPSLRALVGAGHDVALVVSRPDKRRGRGSELTPSPVKAAAVDLGLPVTSSLDELPGSGVELGVVVAYGRIIRPPVLGSVPLVNVHFSLLPRWRGAAPVERAILAGDTVTGVCLMAIEEGLDTGAVYRRAETPIGPDETLSVLRGRLAALGAELLVAGLAEGLGEPVAQEGTATHAAKIEPDELHVDWTRSAEEVLRVVRLERAWTTFAGRRLRILEARPAAAPAGDPPGALRGATVATGAGAVELVRVQPEGRAALAAADWRRGARPGPDEVLGR